MNNLVAVVGMPGCGKSESVKIFEDSDFFKVYFGGVVIEELKKRDMEINEKNESFMREKLREEQGMSAMAKLSIDKIKEKLSESNVVIDGLYSMEEYELLKKEFPNMMVFCVFSSPKTRHERLSKRTVRPLKREESSNRDKNQIKNLHTGGPIALADFTVVNESTLYELKEKTNAFIESITKD